MKSYCVWKYGACVFLLLHLWAFRTYSRNDSLRLVSIASPYTYSDAYSFEKPDPDYKQQFLKRTVVPAVLTITGLGVIGLDPEGPKKKIQEKLNWNKHAAVNLFDDEIRWMPYALGLALPLFGMTPKHKPLHLFPLMLSSYCLADMVVYRTKSMTKIKRPNSDHLNTFPSQHTSMSFVAATVVCHEFGAYSPWISVASYLMAGYVGYARIANNAHWSSDVFVGAAVGLLSTHAVYFCYDLIADKLTRQNEQLSLLPYVGVRQGGIALSYAF